uniref:FMN hydroxy acid dehydrogenase domain-containing protein n=1 Tax=Panagrolaimus sp. JU765 TaxID=591449 RepID=A0AC34RRG9_9BILA
MVQNEIVEKLPKMNSLSQFISISDVEKRALELLPKSVRDYYKSGADDEQTLKRNRKAYKKYLIRPLVLVDVSNINTKVAICFSENSVFHFDYPIGIAPTAFHKMAHPEGELATVRGANLTKTLMICSTLSTTKMEDVASEALPETSLWFQLYVYKDRSVTQNLVQRAISSGFKALVLTVDAPVIGRRRADEKNGFELPPNLSLANFDADLFSKTAKGEQGTSGFGAYSANLFDLSLDWKDLKWLVDYSKIPVIVKGIMRGCDAKHAIDAGAKGIVVSNHGGRQLDHAPSTAKVVKAVNKRCPVFVDGGIRSGTDVYKAVALGADMVFVGRPIIYGLTVGGAEGVKHVINLLRNEFEYAMKLAGTPTIESMRKNNMIVREEYFSKL